MIESLLQADRPSRESLSLQQTIDSGRRFILQEPSKVAHRIGAEWQDLSLISNILSYVDSLGPFVVKEEYRVDVLLTEVHFRRDLLMNAG